MVCSFTNPPSPHLKAIIPWEGVSDQYREAKFHGGIPETRFARFWYENQSKRWPGVEIITADALNIKMLVTILKVLDHQTTKGRASAPHPATDL